MGERITACPACAARQGIKHDPKARRKAERQNVELNKFEDDLDPATLISSALRYLLGQ
jgi:sulfur relay (sulfurtransferase) complex TusBCD TusD component (DsrE family)